MKKTVKIFIILIMIAGIIGGYLLSRQKQHKRHTGPLKKLTIGSTPQEASSLVYLAKEERYFEENGLDVEIIRYDFGFAAIQALLDKRVDIAFATDFAFVSSSFHNKELRILCSISQVDVEELIARKDSGISGIEDLKGKRIGVKKNSSGEFHLDTFLLFHGISFKDIDIMDLAPPELVEAILKKRIDATVLWPPFTHNLKKELGENAVSWSAQSEEPFFWLAITTENKMNEKHSIYKKFLECLSKSERFLKENEMKARQIITKHLDVNDTDVNYFWPRHRFRIELPQSLLLRLENEARWKIKNDLTHKKGIPNYLDFISPDILEQIRPGAMTIIR